MRNDTVHLRTWGTTAITCKTKVTEWNIAPVFSPAVQTDATTQLDFCLAKLRSY